MSHYYYGGDYSLPAASAAYSSLFAPSAQPQPQQQDASAPVMPILSRNSLPPLPAPVPAPVSTGYTLPSYEYLSNLVASLPTTLSYPSESFAATPQPFPQHYTQPLYGIQSYQPQPQRQRQQQ